MDEMYISLWFRNKFPAIALCVDSMTKNHSRSFVRVSINDYLVFYRHGEDKYKWEEMEMNHLHIFPMQMENKWNLVEVYFGFPFKKSGIYVLKEKNNMKDIRFTNLENDVNIELTL